MSIIDCPECESPLKIKSRLRHGQHITCRVCRTGLAVISLDPIEVDVAEDDHHRHSEYIETKQRRQVRKLRE